MCHYTMLCKYDKRTRDCFRRFYFNISLVFYDLGAFLIKKVIPLALVRYGPIISISNEARARGMIVY